MKVLFFLSCLAVLLVVISCQTVPPEEQQCNRYAETDCSTCLNLNGSKGINFQCYWCSNPTNESAPKCRHFDSGAAFPIHGLTCPDLKYNVLTCALNALTIVILIAVACLLFVILITTICCCCCCWCAKRRKRVKMLEEAKYHDQKDSIRQRSAERRAERKAKHDEIRRKYGLYQDDPSDGTYKRLD